MTEFIQGVAVIVLYRTLTILCGLAIVYLGYVLFRLGVYEKAGELKAAWGNKNLALKQAAPGTFFALFGAAVIAATVWRGLDFTSVKAPDAAQVVIATQSQPDPAASAASGNSRADSLILALGQPTKIPDEVKTAIKSATAGNQLSEQSRKVLAQWFEAQQKLESTIQYRAYKPKPSGSPGGLPQDAPTKLPS